MPTWSYNRICEEISACKMIDCRCRYFLVTCLVLSVEKFPNCLCEESGYTEISLLFLHIAKSRSLVNAISGVFVGTCHGVLHGICSLPLPQFLQAISDWFLTSF